MLKFFRSIRRKLLAEGSFRKYLVYAIGEILLVVIGILIALQVNNWNESRNNRAAERKYLQDLVENVEADIISIEWAKRRDSLKMIDSKMIIEAFQNKALTQNAEVFRQRIINIAVIPRLTLKNIVFEDLISSGKLHLIKEDSIRHQIQNYYQLSDRLDEKLTFNNAAILDVVMKIGENLDLNSIFESSYPEEQRAEVDSLDLSFFDRTTDDPLVRNFVDKMTIRRNITRLNNNSYRLNLRTAEKLQKNIEAYLDSTQ